MAEIRTKLIVDLPIAQQLQGLELIPVQQDGITKKIDTQDIINFTKRQDYATWTNVASTHLLTNFLTAQNVSIIRQRSDFGQPEFFIGEFGLAPVTSNSQLTGLTGFKFFYNENDKRFVFTQMVSTLSGGSIQNLTAFHINRFATTYINSLSTANTLSSNKILITDNSANNALEIHQHGSGRALVIYDQAGDTTPLVVDGSGRLGINQLNPTSNLHVVDNSSNPAAFITQAGSGAGLRITQTGTGDAILIEDQSSDTSPFVVKSDGKVGIGVASPDGALEVSGTIMLSGFPEKPTMLNYVNSGLILANAQSDWGTSLRFGNINNANPYSVLLMSGSGNDTHTLLFGTRFGNVGIGTTVPTRKNASIRILDVNGDINSAETIYDSGGNSKQWNSGYSTWNSLSGFHQAARSFVNTTSANIGRVNTKVIETSSVWDQTYNRFSSNSATYATYNYVNKGFLPLSGGTVTGTVNVSGLATFGNNVRILGSLTANQFTVLNVQVLPVTATSLNIDNDATIGRNLLVSVSAKINDVLVVEKNTRINDILVATKNIYTSGIFIDPNGNSQQWNSGYSTWNSLSGFHQAARSFVNTTSANIGRVNTKVIETSSVWDQTYSTWSPLSTITRGATTFASQTSSITNQVNAYVPSTSASFILNGGNSPTSTLLIGTNNTQSLQLETNNSAKVTILSGGNVGINENTPTAKLQVVDNSANPAVMIQQAGSGNGLRIIQTGTGHALFVEDESGGDSTPFVINSSGRVGIGTINPASELSVIGNASLIGNNEFGPSFQLDNRGFAGGRLWSIISSGSANGSGAGNLEFFGSTGGNAVFITSGNVGINTSNPTARLMVANNTSEACWFSGGTFGSQLHSWLGLGGYTNSTHGAFRLNYHRNTGDITFNGGTLEAPIPRLTITGSGNVGIGVTAPPTALTVVGTICATQLQSAGIVSDRAGNSTSWNSVHTSVSPNSANWNSGYSTWNSLSGFHQSARAFVNANSANMIYAGGNSPASTLLIGTNNTQSLQLETNNSAKVTILSGGNVGIGLTNPSEILDVSGNIKTSGIISTTGGNSTNWNSVYSTFQTTSAKLISLRGSQTLTTNQTIINIPSHVVNDTIMDVYLNGVKLIAGTDFTRSATTITLTKPAVNNDYVLEYVIAGLANPTANAVPLNGGTMTGSLTVPTLTVTNTLNAPPNLTIPPTDSNKGGTLKLQHSTFSSSYNWNVGVVGTGTDPDLRFTDRNGTDHVILKSSTGNLNIGSNVNTSKVYILQNNTSNYGLTVNNGANNTGDAVLIYNDSPSAVGLFVDNVNTSGTGTALLVRNRGTGSSFVVQDELNDSTPFIIDNAGRVGIGKTPATNTKLYIFSPDSAPTANPELQISGSNSGALFINNNTSSGSWGGLAQTGDKAFVWYASGGVNTGGIAFQQWHGGTGITPRGFRIDPNGNFGISTANPNERLTVFGNISASGKIYGDTQELLIKDKTRSFWKFSEKRNFAGSGCSTFQDTGAFLSLDGAMHIAGYNGQAMGVGLWGLGSNKRLQATGFVRNPIPLSSTNEFIDKFWVSRYNYFALTNLGNLWGVGKNTTGQLGQNNSTDSAIWRYILGNVVDFHVMSNNDDGKHCLAVVSSGNMFAWGANDSFQLGLPKTGNTGSAVWSPTLITTGSIGTAISQGRKILRVYACGAYQNQSHAWSVAIDDLNRVHVVGNNTSGQLGLNDLIERSTWTLTSNFADEVWGVGYTTSRHYTFLLRNGRVFVSGGDNTVGETGLGSIGAAGRRQVFTEITSLGTNVISLATTIHGCYSWIALRSDGRIYTWGANNGGILGTGNTTDSGTPTWINQGTNAYGQTVTLPSIVKVLGGGGNNPLECNFICLDINGNIWTSGDNTSYQKGIGSTNNDNRFNLAIKGPDVRFVDIDVCNNNNTDLATILAADQRGDIWGVGYNGYGTFGKSGEGIFNGSASSSADYYESVYTRGNVIS